MALLAILVLVAAVAWLVIVPLRGGSEQEAEREGEQIADLELAKEAKYREIRELELDLRTGKLSREDFRATDRALRAEAVELLRRIDALGGARDLQASDRPEELRASAPDPVAGSARYPGP